MVDFMSFFNYEQRLLAVFSSTACRPDVSGMVLAFSLGSSLETYFITLFLAFSFTTTTTITMMRITPIGTEIPTIKGRYPSWKLYQPIKHIIIFIHYTNTFIITPTLQQQSYQDIKLHHHHHFFDLIDAFTWLFSSSVSLWGYLLAFGLPLDDSKVYYSFNFYLRPSVRWISFQCFF